PHRPLPPSHHCHTLLLFFVKTKRPLTPPLFPYTTLFRSHSQRAPSPVHRRSPGPSRLRRHLAAHWPQPDDFTTLYRCPHDGTSADRKSTRLNSSHVKISYAVFCLKKKKTKTLAHDGHSTM